MARYQEQPGFRPTSVDTGESQMYGGLAQKFAGFSGKMMGIHEQYRVAQAQEDAAAAAPIGSELKDNITSYGTAYNDVLLRANQAATKSVYSLKLEEIAAKHPNNPAAFAAEANAIRSEVLANALPPVRQMMEIGYDNLSSSYLNRVKAKHKSESLRVAKLESKAGVERTQSGIARCVRSGDYASAAVEFEGLRQMLTLSGLAQVEQDIILSSTRREMDEQLRLNELDTVSPGSALKQIETMSKTVPDNFSPDEWDKFISQATSHARRRKVRIAEDKIELTTGQEKAISDLIVDINTGKGDQVAQTEAVDLMHTNGWITSAKRTSLLTTIKVASAKVEVDQVAASAIKARMEGNRSIVIPAKHLDKYYDVNYRTGTPAQKANFAIQQGQIPKSLKSEIVNGLQSGDPVLMFNAADMVDRMGDVPSLDSTIGLKAIAISSRISELSYLEPGDAVKTAMKIVDPDNKVLVENRESAFSDIDQSDHESVVMSEFGEAPPMIMAEMINDYKKGTEGLYVSGMELDKSGERQIKRMGLFWGKSDVNDQWVKYPYENFYGPETVDVSRSHLLKMVQDSAESRGVPGNVDIDQVILRHDDQTAREAMLGKPTYLVYHNTSKGLELLDERWVPPVEDFDELVNAERAYDTHPTHASEKERQRLIQEKLDWAKTEPRFRMGQ